MLLRFAKLVIGIRIILPLWDRKKTQLIKNSEQEKSFVIIHNLDLEKQDHRLDILFILFLKDGIVLKWITRKFT